MKKQMKKLTLAKETLQNLNRPELRRVAGATLAPTWQSCATCITCDYCGFETSAGPDACECVGSLRGC
jgi:hypothetical protein